MNTHKSHPDILSRLPSSSRSTVARATFVNELNRASELVTELLLSVTLAEVRALRELNDSYCRNSSFNDSLSRPPQHITDNEPSLLNLSFLAIGNHLMTREFSTRTPDYTIVSFHITLTATSIDTDSEVACV